jgi:hypothetical protein
MEFLASGPDDDNRGVLRREHPLFADSARPPFVLADGVTEGAADQVNPRRLQHIAHLWPCHPNRCQLCADVRNLYVIHDYVVIEGSKELSHLRLIRVDRQEFAAIICIQVAQNMSLRIQQESIYTMPNSEIANVIRDHPVQPPDPITAGNADLRAATQVVYAAT